MTLKETLLLARENSPGIFAAFIALGLLAILIGAILPFLLLRRQKRSGFLVSLASLLAGAFFLVCMALLLYAPVSIFLKVKFAAPTFILPWTGGIGIVVFAYYSGILTAKRRSISFGTAYPLFLCAISGLGAGLLAALAWPLFEWKDNEWLIVPAFLAEITIAGIASSFVQKNGAISRGGLILAALFYLLLIAVANLLGSKGPALLGVLFVSALPAGLYALLALNLSRIENIVSGCLAGLAPPLMLLTQTRDASFLPALLPGVTLGFCLGYLWPAVRESFRTQTYWFAGGAGLVPLACGTYALLVSPWSILNFSLMPVFLAVGLIVKAPGEGPPGQAWVKALFFVAALLLSAGGLWAHSRLGIVEMSWSQAGSVRLGGVMPAESAATGRTIELPLNASVYVEPEQACGRGVSSHIGRITAGARKAVFEGHRIPENALSQEMSDFAARLGARVVFDDALGYSIQPVNSRHLLLYNEAKAGFLDIELGESGRTLSVTITGRISPCLPGSLPGSFRIHPAYLADAKVDWLVNREARLVLENTEIRPGLPGDASVSIRKGMIVSAIARSAGRALTLDGWIDESALGEVKPMDESYYTPVGEFLLERELEQNAKFCHRNRRPISHGPGTALWEIRSRLVEVQAGFRNGLIVKIGDVELRPAFYSWPNRREIAEEEQRLRQYSASGSGFKVRGRLEISFYCPCDQNTCHPSHNVGFSHHENDFEPASRVEEELAGRKTVFFSRPYLLDFKNALAMCQSLDGLPPSAAEMKSLLEAGIASRLKGNPGAFWTAECRHGECSNPGISGSGKTAAVVCIRRE